MYRISLRRRSVTDVKMPRAMTSRSIFENQSSTWFSQQLTSLTGPVTGATTAFTYDGYGRMRTTTDADSYTVTMDYDALDRPTQTTYPDGTTEQTQYQFLDVAGRKDRLGRWTTFTYDAMRRQTSVRVRNARLRAICYSVARIYYNAVVRYGQGAYDESQRHCHGKPDGSCW